MALDISAAVKDVEFSVPGIGSSYLVRTVEADVHPSQAAQTRYPYGSLTIRALTMSIFIEDHAGSAQYRVEQNPRDFCHISDPRDAARAACLNI